MMDTTTPPRRHKQSTMLPIFRLRLRNGVSIGPTLLRRLWALAAESESVSVSRDAGRPGQAAAHHTYVVSALKVPFNLAAAETNLRRLLQECLSAAHIELTRLV